MTDFKIGDRVRISQTREPGRVVHRDGTLQVDLDRGGFGGTGLPFKPEELEAFTFDAFDGFCEVVAQALHPYLWDPDQFEKRLATLTVFDEATAKESTQRMRAEKVDNVRRTLLAAGTWKITRDGVVVHAESYSKGVGDTLDA